MGPDTVELEAATALAVVAERERIARDLHDGPLQLLYAVGVNVHTAADLLQAGDRDEGIALLASAARDLDAVNLELRQVATGLRFEPAGGVRTCFEAIARLCGPAATLAIDVDDDAAAALTGWRADHAVLAAREAVANALRHGAAASIALELHRDGGDVVLVVDDAGSGLAAGLDESDPRPSGHRNLRERAIAVGGSLRIAPAHRGGVRVELRIPT